MIYIETGCVSPYVNLAFEEYFLNRNDIKENILMLWQNEPTIVVGRYQNTVQEINANYLDNDDIHIVRRQTGGGAVYHDLGNLCYSFILCNVCEEKMDYASFAKPVIEAIKHIGVEVQLSGRNDLLLSGAKCSGTAMKLSKNKLLFHGTLLFDSDLTKMASILNVDIRKIRSKGLKSVKSRVTNIKPFCNGIENISQFKHALKEYFMKNYEGKEYALNDFEISEICNLAKDKYMSREWIFSNDTQAEITRDCYFDGGRLLININLDKGCITECKIRGDFIGYKDVSLLEDTLVGVEYTEEAIKKQINTLLVGSTLGSITVDQLIKCILRGEI